MKFGLVVLPLFGLLLSCNASRPGVPASPRFEDVGKQTGLDFWQYSGATGDFRLPEIIGSGAALIDYDNDGDLDVYLVQGAPTGPDGKPLVPLPAGWKPGNRLFRNNLIPSGKLSFTDVTESAGVGNRDFGMGVAAGDYDNDGYPDLYVTNYGHNVLYHNNGNGTFTDVTRTAGVQSSGWSTSAAFIDYDRDGLLDLAVVHYVDDYPAKCYSADGRRDYCAPKTFDRTVTQLFRNLGNGRFEDVTSASGLNAARGPGLGILTGDFAHNGWPSFLVANDGAANHLWLNEESKEAGHNGRMFREEGLTHGLAYASDGKARAGMGVAAGDIYGDGGESVVVTNLPHEGFSLFQRQPDGNSSDASAQTGLFHFSLPYAGFGVGLLDMENRGLLDLFAAKWSGRQRHAGRSKASAKSVQLPAAQSAPPQSRQGKGLRGCDGFIRPGAGAGGRRAGGCVRRREQRRWNRYPGDRQQRPGAPAAEHGARPRTLDYDPAGGCSLQPFRIRKRCGVVSAGWQHGSTLGQRRRQLSRRQRSQSSLRVG